jgi:hypothetical protein
VGGLIAKLAYMESMAHPTNPSVRLHRRLRGIAFLATPHRGDDEDWGRLLTSCHGGKLSHQECFSVARELNDINERFAIACGNLPLISLCERQPVTISGQNAILVTERNARLGLTNESFDRLVANHHNVCKYESPRSWNYRLVRNSLASLLADARAKP